MSVLWIPPWETFSGPFFDPRERMQLLLEGHKRSISYQIMDRRVCDACTISHKFKGRDFAELLIVPCGP